MAVKKFIFKAQPALDKAVDHQKTCEEAVVTARKALESEKQKLQRLMEELETIVQQLRSRHDNLVSPARTTSDPRDLIRAGQYLEQLKRKKELQEQKIDQQKSQVAWAQEKLEHRKKDLSEAMADVQALEKLKENRKKEFELALAKAEESRRDDDAIQLWNTRQKE